MSDHRVSPAAKQAEQRTLAALRRMNALLASGVPIEATEVRRVETQDGPMHIRRHVVLGLLLLLITGCGLPSSDVSPVPIGADAAHVIPAATREYNAGLADVYEGLANRVENGELKTVRDAATVAVSEDQRLRTEYKRAIGDVMETRLGGEELPSDAPAFFREMSAAFRRMSK